MFRTLPHWARWGLLLGFSLGGFFDGVLLHQILQWHHLLSLVPGMADLRLQILWDGYFHALMYLLAGASLWGLWRGRARDPDRAWITPPMVLIGFGAWHVVDTLLSHWLLGIHRIRLDSPTPLAWDLFWLAAFGLLPLVCGAVLAQRSPKGPRGRHGPLAMLLILAGASVGAGAWALKPPPATPFTTVVFSPGVSAPGVLAALDAVDGRLVWSDPSMAVVLVAMDDARRFGLYRHGALLVGGAGLPGGCAVWGRPS